MSSSPAPARVFGFVAAEADVCVLLRRGPSKRVLMVRWDLATDEFEVGQWLKARVYAEGCDLSPDGRLFAYRARDGRLRNDVTTDYIAVSRPPFFTALALWESSSYTPGFRWVAPLLELLPIRSPTKGTLPTAYRHRLAPEDFQLSMGDRGWSSVGLRRSTAYERASSLGRLRWFPWDRFRTHPVPYTLNDRPLDADWADADRRGRLILARAGRVYVRDANGERELIDLNPFEFRPLAPPDWATEWPA